jgi:hypothetical protein
MQAFYHPRGNVVLMAGVPALVLLLTLLEVWTAFPSENGWRRETMAVHPWPLLW